MGWPFKTTSETPGGVPEWVDASERLPTEMQVVIVYAHPFPEPEVYIGWYAQGFWYVHGNKCRVTHWIPLPDPPLLGVEAQPG